MSQVRKVLGKGLVQLIGEQDDATVKEVSVESIEPNPHQPRRDLDEEALGELAESVRSVGVLQPIVVRPIGHDRYEIIAGERRWRAAKMAGIERVPVVVRTSDETDSLALALIENLQRQDLQALEAAAAYGVLIERFGLTQEAVAERVGKSRSSIANALRLLRLPQEIQQGLAEGKITEGHARALLQFEIQAEMLAVYRRILEKDLTVRDVERLAQQGAGSESNATPRRAPTPLEQAVSERLGVPVRIVRKKEGGRLEVIFYSDDDLDRVLSVLGVRLDD